MSLGAFGIVCWRARADDDAVRVMAAARCAALLGSPVALWLIGPVPEAALLQRAQAAGQVLLHRATNPEAALATGDLVLALAADEPGLSLALPAVARLSGAAPAGVLGVSGEDADELGDALAFLASDPDLRRMLRRERQEGFPAGVWQVYGPFDSSFSLALVNRELAKALAQRGLEVALDGLAYREGRSPDWQYLGNDRGLKEFHARADAPAAVVLANDYPPNAAALPRAPLTLLANYAWEETGYPAGWVREFNWRLDLLTVCSPLTKKILRDAGVRRPIAVVGNGIDHLSAVTPIPMPEPLGSDGRLRFLHVSTGLPRKGGDVMISAYGQAFTADDAVSLVIKTEPNEANILYRSLREARANRPDFPEVTLIDRDLSAGEMAWLYRQCDVLLLTPRAEGFGLPIAEAALAGLPCVTSAWGGQLGFVDETTAFLVPGRFAPAQSHLGIADSLWFEPDSASLVETLRRVAATPREALRSMAERLAQRLRQRYTWSDVARRTEAAVRTCWQAPTLRMQPRVAWISTWDSRCGLATYSEHLTARWPAERLLILANRDAQALGRARADVRVERAWTRGDLAVARLVDLIRQHGCGAVVAQHHPGLYPAASLGELAQALAPLGIPCYATLHNTRQIRSEDRAPLLALRRLLVHGWADLDRLAGLGLGARSTLFPHGIYPPPTQIDGLLEQAGLAGKRLIATFGFLMPHKGLYEVLCAFERLATQRPELHLLMLNALYPAAFSHAERDRLQERIDQARLGDRVTLVTEFLPDPLALAWLAQAELALFAYQFTDESASGAVRMALAAGCPTLVTPLPIFDDVAAAVDYLEDGTPEAIARGVERMLERLADPAQRLSARERVQRFSQRRQWPLLGERLLNLIDGEANDPFPEDLMP